MENAPFETNMFSSQALIEWCWCPLDAWPDLASLRPKLIQPPPAAQKFTASLSVCQQHGPLDPEVILASDQLAKTRQLVAERPGSFDTMDTNVMALLFVSNHSPS